MSFNNSKKYNFLLEGNNGKAVLLIHGITGTPSEMRHVGKVLNKAGYTVFCSALPRHCSSLGELKKVTWQEIADACKEDFLALKAKHEKVFIAGLSMGALMSIHLAYQYPQEVSGIAVLAPTIFYDGWALHKGKVFLNFVWNIPYLRNRINIREGWPYGLKDEDLRWSIERFYKDANANKFSNKVLLFGSPFFPLANLYQHNLFTKLVIKELKKVTTPAVIIHAKEDDMTSLKNARFVLDNIGSPNKSLVVLEDSYHMITIDKEKDRVAEEIISFFNKL
ncbi:MAG: alpha/beta fold hydrolase [Candidatus Omnitrophica bacterium]|jgi:carboxylesterase|nr:alpha/beta fold hydrolase [Candidatus Omnitrophota bacterium]